MTGPQDDIDRVMTVMERSFDPQFGEAWTRRQVEDALLIGNCHLLLAGPQGGRLSDYDPIAGFALSRQGFEEEELLLLAVLPEYRSLGLGRYLIGELKRCAAERGARQLFLEMREGNPAEKMYQSSGFLPIGRRIKYYRTPFGHRIDAITFSCAL